MKVKSLLHKVSLCTGKTPCCLYSEPLSIIIHIECQRITNISILADDSRLQTLSLAIRFHSGRLKVSCHEGKSSLRRNISNMFSIKVASLVLLAVVTPSVLGHGQVHSVIISSPSATFQAADAYAAADPASPLRKLNTYGPAANFTGPDITCGVCRVLYELGNAEWSHTARRECSNHAFGYSGCGKSSYVQLAELELRSPWASRIFARAVAHVANLYLVPCVRSFTVAHQQAKSYHRL